jgi:hypothetical protein
MNPSKCEVRILSADIRTSGACGGVSPLGDTTTTTKHLELVEVRTVSAPRRR